MASKGKLIIVTSDQIVRMLLLNYLKGLGYDIWGAADTLELLGLIGENDPELILTKEGGAGVPFSNAIVDASVGLPIMVLAAEERLEECRNERVVAALPWPSPRPLVARTVERILTQVRASRLSIVTAQPRDTAPAEAEPEGALARTIGRYRIEALIGRGGMGDVYRCYDDLTRRVVAVKTIRCPLGAKSFEEDPHVERFRVEAAALSRLLHPRIVATYHFGVDQNRGEMYLVMQYVDGPSLRHRIESGRLPIDEALRIGWELADALAHAHERGVVHRDVKPENVLITDLGEPLLTDFGLARLGNFSVSDGRVIAGTPAYMAPEQILSPRDVDERTDQFGLGAMLHEMLTGADCFTGNEDRRATLLARLEVTWPTLASLGLEAPESLQTMLTRMLQKEPRSRYPTDGELLDAFMAVGADLGLAFERL
jgi:tRNA A-37 threonylcarbamoyl transferase component Bud32/CheY-like chemotaxis protein